jgi:hypothetical protein
MQHAMSDQKSELSLQGMALLVRLPLCLWVGDNDLAKVDNVIGRSDERLIFCTSLRESERYDIGGPVYAAVTSIEFVNSFIAGNDQSELYR